MSLIYGAIKLWLDEAPYDLFHPGYRPEKHKIKQIEGVVETEVGFANGRSSESRQARLDGRVVTDKGEANGDERQRVGDQRSGMRLAYQKLNCTNSWAIKIINNNSVKKLQ